MNASHEYLGSEDFRWHFPRILGASHVVPVLMNVPANAEVRDVGSIPGLGRFP